MKAGEAIIEMREAENGGDSSESEVEGGEEVGYHPIPYYIEKSQHNGNTSQRKRTEQKDIPINNRR